MYGIHTPMGTSPCCGAKTTVFHAPAINKRSALTRCAAKHTAQLGLDASWTKRRSARSKGTPKAPNS